MKTFFHKGSGWGLPFPPHNDPFRLERPTAGRFTVSPEPSLSIPYQPHRITILLTIAAPVHLNHVVGQVTSVCNIAFLC